MLKTLNIAVFYRQEILQLYKDIYGEEETKNMEKLLFPFCDKLNAIYLPTLKDKNYYNDFRNKLAKIIVENSRLKYGDTAYVL